MPRELTDQVTGLLVKWRSGDPDALDRLTQLVYDELKRIARRAFRSEAPGHTLQPTALVNEAFEKLVGVDVEWQDRNHFFALSARLMRRILVNHAEARRAAKRGGEALHVTYSEELAAFSDSDADILALDQALEELAGFDERKARMVELHYFSGLTYPELARATGMAESTVHADLRAARAWLQHRLASSDDS